MTNIITILRERFPRLVDGVLGSAPDVVKEHVTDIAVDESDAAELRKALARIPDDKIERITDASLKFFQSVLFAGMSLFTDIGPSDMGAALAYLVSKAKRDASARGYSMTADEIYELSERGRN